MPCGVKVMVVRPQFFGGGGGVFQNYSTTVHEPESKNRVQIVNCTGIYKEKTAAASDPASRRFNPKAGVEPLVTPAL